MDKRRVWKTCLLVICSISICLTFSFEGKAQEGQTPYSPEGMEFERSGDKIYTGEEEYPLKKPSAIDEEWEENSEIMNTLMTSGKKSGVEAIAYKYGISKEKAKEKFKASMKYFEEKSQKESSDDDILWYPEAGLKVAKGAGIASSMILSVVVPGLAAVDSTNLAVVAGGSGLSMTGFVSAGLKMTALAEEYGASLLGKKPNWKFINYLNGVSDNLNTVSLIGGTALSAPSTVLDVVSTIAGAVSDPNVGKAATALKGQSTDEKKTKNLKKDKKDPSSVTKKVLPPKTVVKDQAKPGLNCEDFVGNWNWANGGIMTFSSGGSFVWKRGAGKAPVSEYNPGTWECRDNDNAIVYHKTQYGGYDGCFKLADKETMLWIGVCATGIPGSPVGTKAK